MRPHVKFGLLATLLVISLVAGLGVALAAGPWAKNWSDAPDYGWQNWHNVSSTEVKWVPDFLWYSSSLPFVDTRRIELEWYDPGNGLYCDRLEPFSVAEAGGDWIDTVSHDNQCGGSTKERSVLEIKENNVTANVDYQAHARATKVGSAGSGGEVNVSFSCWYCPGDDWLGKNSYNSSYDDAGSNP